MTTATEQHNGWTGAFLSGISRFWLPLLLTISVTSPVFSQRSLEESLRRAGDNRGELEAALEAMPGRDMEHLIRHARQFDLVNLTSGLLITNLREARKAYAESTIISPKYGYEMWRDYVLPYRVMEEDLSNWRPFLREQMEPVIEGTTSVHEAARKIFRWMHARAEDGKPRVRFVATENRNQNPFQLLTTRNGGCKEMHITYVSALRSVGIPARLCTNAWWTTADWYHYFVQYYDPAIQDWRGIDASNTRGIDPANFQAVNQNWHVMKAYAFPSYPSVKDVDGMQRWDLCTDITEYLCETGQLIVQMDVNEPYTIGLYTWNIGAWRLIGLEKAGAGEAVSITVGETKKGRPLLVSAFSDSHQSLMLTDLEAKNVRRLHMKPGSTTIHSQEFSP